MGDGRWELKRGKLTAEMETTTDLWTTDGRRQSARSYELGDGSWEMAAGS